MRYETFIGKRYLFSPRQDRSISVITWISIGGVALGVVALIVSTSVMNGFRTNLRNAVTGSLPHITIFAWDDAMVNYSGLQKRLDAHPEVNGVAPYIFKQALLTGRIKPKGALLRGIDPQQEANVTRIASYLRDEVYGFTPSPKDQELISTRLLERLSHPEARKKRLKDGIILGAKLARQLEAEVGGSVKLVSSEQRLTPIGDVPRIKKLEVIGIFESGISGYDEVLAFIDYRLLQKIYRMQNKITGLGVRIGDPENAPDIADELADLSEDYIVGNWADENKSIFQVMKIEKIGLFLILSLIIVVAAFNIISSLIMLVLEKSREIAILKALGAKDSGIRRIFFFQGLVIGSLGTIGGVLVGLAICWILMSFDIIDIPPGVYPGGNRIPVLIDWFDVALATVASFTICILVTLYPASKASRLNPVDPLRYE
ncbi:MAG: ABC transporter permease [SAR324 cluster bacterium]|jgi:lipoprotein-releasing system permease protein|uniref:ABC3 transporter permease protein domain-containing protein n=1 Tax=marine metagenome TaxID=408172 RepID=A0A381P278_9ZZZZ|nr:lipoprotein-releasing system transmembrane subunit LolC [Deltaproteobacteria bacterium]MDP6308975.1 ABC transporter permease [SAR324 cluster bacterium]MDP6487703.1 ABC transporter permease [SAR324 cluster bacterium]MDP7170437.1 ABC transporter permease [SAR324 cluster bacterium]MDP7175202.1 ABC transporter permease [SAR324 cluster bacterium]|tara:strand:- start:918 stop:2207 length:1290 start_codon:yes stop_codon:yes gene_type:complete